MKTLSELGVGDKVVVSGLGVGTSGVTAIGRVTHSTAKRVSVGSTVFNRENGLGPKPDSPWSYRRSIRPASDEDIKEHADREFQANAHVKLSRVNWTKIPVSVLKEIMAKVFTGLKDETLP